MPKPLSRLIAALAFLLLLDACLGFGFFALKRVSEETYGKFFSLREAYFRFLDERQDFFETFLKDYHDPALGWNNPRSGHLSSQGCEGVWEAFYNPDGSRKTCSDNRPRGLTILCVGDSFTHGNEVDDCSAYPSVLERSTGLGVGNFGVGGYDVVQSVLQYQSVLSRAPKAKVAVLSVMYENGRRNLNAFRPAYTNSRDLYEAFLFKPFFNGTEIVNPAPGPGSGFADYKKQAARFFNEDYWAQPTLDFPYTLSLAKAVAAPHFLFALRQKINVLRGKGMFAYDYEHPRIREGLRRCVARFTELSLARGVAPIIVFIPAGTKDLRSPNAFIAEMRRDAPAAVILNFGDHAMDWSRYIAREGCHPTAHGYAELARFVQAALPLAALSPNP